MIAQTWAEKILKHQVRNRTTTILRFTGAVEGSKFT